MRWTHEERTWLKDNYYLLPVEQCAEHLGRTPNAIRVQVQYLRKRGWKFSRPPK